MTKKQSVAKLLRILAAVVDNLDPDQVDLLIAGKGQLTFFLPETPVTPTINQPDDPYAMLMTLSKCQDRTEAHLVLSSITRRDRLASLARTLKVHVVKNDKREDIESKIIEFVIGGKLRTEAIQSVNMKSGVDETTS